MVSKYRAQRTWVQLEPPFLLSPQEVVGWRRCDSKGEAQRYAHLLAEQASGHIARLVCQYRLPCHVIDQFGEVHQIGMYVADFYYETHQGPVVEDFKGMRTPLYRWKKAHVEAEYGIRILETDARTLKGGPPCLTTGTPGVTSTPTRHSTRRPRK